MLGRIAGEPKAIASCSFTLPPLAVVKPTALVTLHITTNRDSCNYGTGNITKPWGCRKVAAFMALILIASTRNWIENGPHSHTLGMLGQQIGGNDAYAWVTEEQASNALLLATMSSGKCWRSLYSATAGQVLSGKCNRRLVGRIRICN